MTDNRVLIGAQVDEADKDLGRLKAAEDLAGNIAKACAQAAGTLRALDDSGVRWESVVSAFEAIINAASDLKLVVSIERHAFLDVPQTTKRDDDNGANRG